MSSRRDLRQAVLDAAMDLVASEGPYQLTLEAVAGRAQVSKGGLQHHFKTKESLLAAMVGEIAAAFENNLQRALDASARDSRSLTEVYLKRSFSGLGAHNRSAMALLAVAAHQPELLQPIRDYFQRRAQQIAAQDPAASGMLALMLMADGLWLFDALGIPPLSGRLREQVRDTVLTWVPAPAPAPAPAPTTATPAKQPRRRPRKTPR